jgi:vanillate O-demethylase ferredoxin subunit
MSAGLLTVRVERRTCEADDICSYELVSEDGSDLPAFTAGAHIDVHVAPGLVRQYSLCNAPHERHRYVIGVLRDPASRGGSVAMHAIEPGARLQIGAPRNLFALAEAPRCLLLAGGIGVTPMLAMAEALSTRGAQFELHYCARSPERMAFRDRIAASSFADRAHLYVDTGTAARKLDLPALLADLDRTTHIYFCGPAGFIEYVKATAAQHHWPLDQLHLEYFGATVVEATGDQPFEVTIKSTGAAYNVPAGTTVLQVLQDAGVFVPASCEQGVCGTCLTRVLEGVPDHRDLYLTEEEQAANDQFTPCCSRSKTPRLLLDL